LKNRFFLLALILSAVILIPTSCSIERKLAREFIHSKDSISILLIPPDYLFKSNLKTWQIKNAAKLNADELKIALLDSSLFLKDIDENLLIGKFVTSMKTSLQQYGITIYPVDQMMDFFGNKPEAYQVAIVQMELEEDIFPYRAQEIFFDSVIYYEDFNLEMLVLNNWFEISKLNDTISKHNILFASNYVMDGLEGRFVTNIFTGNVTFRYNYEPISNDHVYTLAEMVGRKYASYVFDFLMNRYIYFGLPPNRKSAIYFTYDRATGKLSPAGENRFIFLED